MGADARIELPLCLLFRKGKLIVLSGCQSSLRDFFRLESGSGIGGSLVIVSHLTNLSGGVSFRATHRAGTALLVCGKMGVAAIRGLLKRGDIGAARICAGMVSVAVIRSLRGGRTLVPLPGGAQA